MGDTGAELYQTTPNDPEARYFLEWMGANSDPRKEFTVSREEILAEFVGSTSIPDFTDKFTIRVREHSNT
jgi:hypothetical protein